MQITVEAMEGYYCFPPLLILLIVAVLLNVTMIRHIYKTKNSSSGAGFMFKFVAISNIASGTSNSIRTIVKATSTVFPLLWLTSTAVVISICLQLGANASLAFERVQVVKHAVKYCDVEAKKGLQRKLSLAILMFSLLIGFSSTTLRFYFNNLLFMLLPLATLRISGYIALCVLYYKLFYAMKTQNQAIAPSLQDAGQQNNAVMIRRRKQVEHAMKFFIGITASFFVFNIPAFATYFSIEEFPYCKTVREALSMMSSVFPTTNMIVDVIWYFYMHWNSRKSSGKR